MSSRTQWLTLMWIVLLIAGLFLTDFTTDMSWPQRIGVLALMLSVGAGTRATSEARREAAQRQIR